MKKIIPFIIFNFVLLSVFAQNKIDLPFTESEVILNTSTGDISGTLTIPNNVSTSPIVLIIAGSGPTDRNCNSSLGIKTNAYKILSSELAKNGISTLRFDKRGIGKSSPAMTSESELQFDVYIHDLIDWIGLLKQDKRFSKIILLGHSEGSLIGMIAAEQVDVSAFISIAGAGRPADEILQEQLKDKLSFQLLEESNNIIDSLKAGKMVSDISQELLSLFRPSIQPYMISWIKYDPAKEIAKLKIPVLIIQGTTDLQVTVDDAKLLSMSKPDARLLIIDNMNHVLKEVDTDIQKNMATYKNPILPLKLGLVDAIVDFIMDKK